MEGQAMSDAARAESTPIAKPRRMPDPTPGAEQAPAEFHGPPSAILNWSKTGAELASRRSHALADYWSALAAVRQPEEAMAVQMDYWSHWIDDYAAATVEALSPFALPPTEGPTAH
jgi:hypothetical protein